MILFLIQHRGISKDPRDDGETKDGVKEKSVEQGKTWGKYLKETRAKIIFHVCNQQWTSRTIDWSAHTLF